MIADVCLYLRSFVHARVQLCMILYMLECLCMYGYVNVLYACVWLLMLVCAFVCVRVLVYVCMFV